MTNRRQFPVIIKEFVELQTSLISFFTEEYKLTSETSIRFQIPSTGDFIFKNDSWHYMCHGIGVLFTRGKKKSPAVDVEECYFDRPNDFTAWRLSGYIGSINRADLFFDAERVQFKNADIVKEYCDILVERGILENDLRFYRLVE